MGTEDNSQLVRSSTRVYRRARCAFEAACEEKNAENLHEWRKLVKYLWHQMQYPRRIGRWALAKHGNELHKLSDDLGDDHDLAVLSEWSEERNAAFSARKHRRDSSRQWGGGDLVCRNPHSAGGQLFSERPAEFADWLTKATHPSRAA